ncbi:MAG: transketolase family protein, partial [bacterium]
MSEKFDCRDAFGKALEELAASDERVVVVVNDSVGSSKLNAFKKAFPERVVNVGIAEQDL